MTTRKRHTPEQVVRKLTQADRLLGEGKDVADVCRELGVAEQTYYRWRNQFGGLKADDAKKLKDLERENRELKRANEISPEGVRVFRTGGARPPSEVMVAFIDQHRESWTGGELAARIIPSSGP